MVNNDKRFQGYKGGVTLNTSGLENSTNDWTIEKPVPWGVHCGPLRTEIKEGQKEKIQQLLR